MMGSPVGLWMLLALAVLILTTGLPVWALLIGVASLFAALGCAVGVMDLRVLGAVSGRILGLLDNDLLQALPLYVLFGVLVNRIAVADALFSVLARVLYRTGAASGLACLGVGLLLAPLNGSVASSSALLSRVLGPRLQGQNASGAVALSSAAATIGVVVPPSLVLILLGDAMLRAHTEASNLAGYALGGQRIINTQDVFRAALLPAVGILVMWAVIVWSQRSKAGPQPAPKPLPLARWATALTLAAGVVVLLGGVFLGKFLAVEAAASACLMLLMATAWSRSLTNAQWSQALKEALQLSGALMALLLGATTFSLVFRLWGSDQWIAGVVMKSGFAPSTTASVVLLGVGLCAALLDAFEMIFVVIPLMAPLLIVGLGDAQQVSVLLLLVLQTSYLIPPMGYAVLLSRQQARPISTMALLGALVPYVACLCATIVLVFVAPQAVHLLDAASGAVSVETLSGAVDVEQKMREMSKDSREQGK